MSSEVKDKLLHLALLTTNKEAQCLMYYSDLEETLSLLGCFCMAHLLSQLKECWC